MKRRLPVVLYIPNLLGYARIILSFVGLFFSSTQEHDKAIITWVIAAILDFLDGIIARWLNQTSTYGVLIDVAADNILRSCIWISCIATAAAVLAKEEAMSVNSSSSNAAIIISCSTLIICLEWCTMVATQLLQSSTIVRNHWKEGWGDDPRMVQMLFRNNFRNPIGALGIYGLFASPIALYISLISTNNNINISILGGILTTTASATIHSQTEEYIAAAIWIILQYAAHLGRCICIPIEFYFICKYLLALANEDEISLAEQKDN